MSNGDCLAPVEGVRRKEILAEGIFADFERRLCDDLMKGFGLSTNQIQEVGPPLTADTLLAQMRELEHMRPAAPDIRIIFTGTALEKSSERLFPPSRHRSARVLKKLISRHGGEYRYVPALWQIGNVIYAHPLFRKDIELRIPVAARSAP